MKDNIEKVRMMRYKMLLVGEEDVKLEYWSSSSQMANFKKYRRVIEFDHGRNPEHEIVVVLTVRSEYFNIQRIFVFDSPCNCWFLETYEKVQKYYVEKDDISKIVHDPEFYINDIIGNTVGYLNRNYKENEK